MLTTNIIQPKIVLYNYVNEFTLFYEEIQYILDYCIGLCLDYSDIFLRKHVFVRVVTNCNQIFVQMIKKIQKK